MLADDIMVKMADGSEKRIRNITVGAAIMTFDGNEQTVTAVETGGYSETFAVVTKQKTGKRAIYATLDTVVMSDSGEQATIEDLKINSKLKNAGTVLGVAYSGERKVYKLIADKPYIANGFVVY